MSDVDIPERSAITLISKSTRSLSALSTTFFCPSTCHALRNVLSALSNAPMEACAACAHFLPQLIFMSFRTMRHCLYLNTGSCAIRTNLRGIMQYKYGMAEGVPGGTV